MSLSLLIAFRGFKAFYAGDTEAPTEAKIAARHLVMDVDLYKASHDRPVGESLISGEEKGRREPLALTTLASRNDECQTLGNKENKFMKIRSGAAAALIISILCNANLPAQSVRTIRLPDGTHVAVRLMEPVSSANAKAGDPVSFEVVEDIIVDGQLLIKQGSPARGTVVDAAAKRRMGRAGNLSYTLSETRGVDGQTIRLRATQEKKGDSHVTSTAVTTTAVAVFVPVAAPFFLLRKGKDIIVPSGTRVEAFVEGDHSLRVGSASPTTETRVAELQNGRMTNADVIGLIKAGFSDDLIVAKVRASQRSFSLETSDLLDLKNAGASERVIGAMLQGQ